MGLNYRYRHYNLVTTHVLNPIILSSQPSCLITDPKIVSVTFSAPILHTYLNERLTMFFSSSQG